MSASAPPKRYFLRTAPHVSAPSSRFSNLYLRHHAGGINAIMLVPSGPKFLRFHLSESASKASDRRAHLATSWKHPGRTWSFVLLPDKYESGGRLGRWEEVRIVETLGENGEKTWDDGFEWIKERGPDGTEREILVHRGGHGQKAADGADRQKKDEWRGWLACEWCYGHPQLFWMTGEFKESDMQLPAYCERVVIVREPVSGQTESET